MPSLATVIGFCRLSINSDIPLSIVQIIDNYFHETIHIKIDPMPSNNKQINFSKQCIINHQYSECVFNLNISFNDNLQQTEFKLTLVKYPKKDYYHMTVWILYDICCHPIKSHYSMISPIQFNDPSISFSIHITNDMLSQSQPLQFDIDFNVLEIQFYETESIINTIQYHYSKVMMKRVASYEWKINRNDVELQQNKNKWIYSEYFGGKNKNWQLIFGIFPDQECAMLFLRLCVMPKDVYTMEVKFEIESDYVINNQQSIEIPSQGTKCTTLYAYHSHTKWPWCCNKFDLSSITNSLTFKLKKVEIVEMFDFNHRKIPLSQWSGHGVY